MRRTLTTALILCAGTAPALADCNADLASIWQSFMKAGPYHIDMQINGASGSHSMQGDVILPDKFHMTMPKGEMIMIGGTVWMNMKGQWMQMPSQGAKMMQTNIQQAMAAGLKSHTNAKCLGATTYKDKAVDAYEFDSSGTFAGIAAKSHVQMYAINSLPAFMVVDGEAMSHKSHTEQTITYDPSITITPPK